MARAVGLDIGSRAVKVAVVDGGPKGAKLLRYVEREYDQGDSALLTPEMVLATLKKALAEAKAPKNALSVAMQAEQCIVREISVPFTGDEQIRKVVKFEFEPHLHSAAIDDIVLDFIRTGAARAGARLLIFACVKAALAARLDQLAQTGVDPLHVDVDIASLLNVAHAAGALDEHPNCVIVDIGARTTKALFVEEGALRAARSIRIGTEGARKRLLAEMQGDATETQQALELGGGVEALAQAPSDTMETSDIVLSIEEVEARAGASQQRDFLDRVLRETQRSMPAVSSDVRPTCVFLTGGGAQRPNARERISSHFGCEVRDLSVLGAVSQDLPPSDGERVNASGAVAVGTALKVVGMDVAGVDLRKEEFRFARTFDRVKVALATGVTLAFFAVFLLFLMQVMDFKKLKASRERLQTMVGERLDDEVFKAYEDAVQDFRKGSVSSDPDKYFNSANTRLKTIQSHLKNELGLSTDVPPIRSSLQMWSLVMEAIETVRPKIQFMVVKGEKYAQDKAEITCLFGKYPDADILKNAIREYDSVFANVEGGSPKTDKQGKIEVTIRMDVLPLTPAEVAAGVHAKAGEKESAKGAAEPEKDAGEAGK